MNLKVVLVAQMLIFDSLESESNQNHFDSVSMQVHEGRGFHLFPSDSSQVPTCNAQETSFDKNHRLQARNEGESLFGFCWIQSDS